MPYKPNEFSDIPGDAKMAPSELRPPLNFADGGAVNWASDATIYNTQSQLGNLAATPGGFGGMAKQFTTEAPFGGNAPMPALPMAKGGSVSNLIGRLKEEFSKRGLDFDRAMAQRLAQKGQNGDTMLAHINPQEAQMLKQAGGSGKINPHTGLPSFGVDDGPEAGSTGSASGASYGGNNDSIGQHESVNAAMGRSSAAERDTSYTGDGVGDRGGGGGGGGRDTGPSPAAFRAAEDASMARLADIMSTSPAQLMSNKMIQASQDLSAKNQDIINAQKEENARIANVKTLASLGALADTRPTEYQMAAVMNAGVPTVTQTQVSPLGLLGGQVPETTAFKGENIVPAGPFKDQGMSMPAVRSPEQMAAAQAPTDDFATRMAQNQAMRDSIRAMDQQQRNQAPLTSPNEAYGGTSQEFEKQSPFGAFTQATTTPRPFDAIMSSIVSSNVSQDQASKAEAAAKAAKDTADANAIWASANAPAPLVGMPANVPLPMARPVDLGETATPSIVAKAATPTVTPVAPVAAPATPVAAPVAAVANVPTPVPRPADQQQGILGQIMSQVDQANADRIKQLEKDKQFAGGSREDVAAALNVDPSELKSRIVNYDGQQKVDYYTKDLSTAIGEALTAPFKALGDLFSSNVENLPRGSSVRDPRFADLFTQNVPSKGFGPYGDLTREEYQKQYGGRDYGPQISGPSGGRASASNLPKSKYPFAGRSGETPVEPPPAPLADYRTRIGLPIDPYNYGYGGEYTYYSAKGGAVSPLKKVRK